ncbi:polymer-forming cytoskeletal protein [Patescibacteria group bacterium]
MFKQNEKNVCDKEVETIIGSSVKVKGDFIGKGNVVVEGTVKGSLKTDKNLRVGVNAKIFANVVASNILIAGEVNGNIQAKETLELTETAKIIGDIKAQVITIAPGAFFNGKSEMGEVVEPNNVKNKKIEVSND